MTIVDHLYFVLIAIAAPVVGYFSFRRLLRRVKAGAKISPAHLYRFTMASHWTLLALLLVLWGTSGRAWTDLGFGLEFNTRFMVGAMLTAGMIIALVLQLRLIDRATEKDLGDLQFLFPRTRSELRGFYGLSVTAGIVEEALWRGFLFWYLGHFMPLWAAAIVSAVGFGVAHAYQGPAAIPRIVLVGGAFAGLYLLTGSLLLPMILHALVDLLQGRAVHGMLQRSASVSTPSAA